MITKDTFDDRLADGVIGLVMRFARFRLGQGTEKVEKFYLEREQVTPSVSARPGGHLVGYNDTVDVGFDQPQPEAMLPEGKLTLQGCLLGGLVVVACDLLVGLLGMAVVFALVYGVILLL